MILETAFLIPIVTGLVQALKKFFNLTSEATPFVAIFVGEILALVGFYTIPNIGMTLGEAIFMGLVSGLSGVGFYETGKATIVRK